MNISEIFDFPESATKPSYQAGCGLAIRKQAPEPQHPDTALSLWLLDTLLQQESDRKLYTRAWQAEPQNPSMPALAHRLRHVAVVGCFEMRRHHSGS